MKSGMLAPGALVALLCLASCDRHETPENASVPVTVACPKTADVADYIDLTGTVGAVQSVTIVARVEGYLEEIYFQDGTYVPKGTPLFKIQQDQYIEDVKLYQAQLDYASEEYARQLDMIKKNATSEAEVEKYLSQKQQDEANVALAKLNLSYTMLYAPFDGLLGEHKVDVGNLVGNSPVDPTQLVTIEQIVPIYVNFSINTRDALRIRGMMHKAGIKDKSPVNNTPVYAQLENETGFPHKGVLDFSNNSVDTSTGTIQLRGVFKNEDRTLFPGLFAEVRIPLGDPKPRLVLPDAVILNDQQGDYVYIVNAQNVVERRDVVKGPLNGTARAILSGVSASDHVVVNGIPNIRIGQAVQPTLAPDPVPDQSPAAAASSN
jgi:RND family efflux transporter MFP subunit